MMMTRAPRSDSFPDHRQAGPDPPVVRDPRGRRVGEVQRHIQVSPQQHPPPGDVQAVDTKHRHDRLAATRAVRSASRLE